ncbi:unnamed protein product [Linum tenue]|uniref:KIB1-4 beta-propeller domain-containing protein n=1 Tax=Linum tenue TaxID=586396 RepID=A0AAV0IT16_9ROSI|nr:unnamed protein product [Linum tenue]
MATPAVETIRNGRDWAWLPELILDSVLQNLVSLQDYLQFSSVCKPWHAAAESQKRRRIATSPQNQAPLLMVPTKDRSHLRRGLYSATARNRLLETTLPVPWHRRCCGSSHGWLAFLEEEDRVTLYNPFTQARISLPTISGTSHLRDEADDHFHLYTNFAKKIVLSADPSTHGHDYVVAALINYPVYRTLAVIRPGRDDKWTNYTGPEELSTDLIFHQGWIYATAYRGMLARANVEGVGTRGYVPVLEMVVPQWSEIYEISKPSYLVESSSGDELLMVVRCLEERDHEFSFVTADVKVFKLVRAAGASCCHYYVEVEDLNGDAVFIGDSYSVAVPAAEFQGCEADTVYFSDDYVEVKPHYFHLGPHDIGKFNVKERKFGTHFYVADPAQNRGMPPPIWVFPTLMKQ